MQSPMCLQLFSPKCLSKLYHRPCSVISCNYPGIVKGKTETQETEMLRRLAARVHVRFALPPSSFLFQQRDHTASEVRSSANILQGLSKLLANSLNSYLAYIMCYDFSLFLSQKGFESNINHSPLIEGSNSSDYGQRHREVWVMRVPEKPRHVMAIQDVGMRLRGSTWAVNPWVGS